MKQIVKNSGEGVPYDAGVPEKFTFPPVEPAKMILDPIPEFDKLIMIAEKLFTSGLFTHLDNPEQAVAVIEYGREIGVPPMQSLQMMAVIKGKLCMQSQLMLALVRKKGCDVKILVQNKDLCRIDFIRDGVSHEVEFTFKEAQALNLTHKDNWKNQPANMNFWRCISKGIKYHASDLILGAYLIEEISEGEYTTVSELSKQQEIPEPSKKDIIKRLLEERDVPQEKSEKILAEIDQRADDTLEKVIDYLLSLPKKKPPTAEEVLNSKKEKNGKEKIEPKEEHTKEFVRKFREAYIKCYAKDNNIPVSKIAASTAKLIDSKIENLLNQLTKKGAQADLDTMLNSLKGK